MLKIRIHLLRIHKGHYRRYSEEYARNRSIFLLFTITLCAGDSLEYTCKCPVSLLHYIAQLHHYHHCMDILDMTKERRNNLTLKKYSPVAVIGCSWQFNWGHRSSSLCYLVSAENNNALVSETKIIIFKWPSVFVEKNISKSHIA